MTAAFGLSIFRFSGNREDNVRDCGGGRGNLGDQVGDQDGKEPGAKLLASSTLLFLMVSLNNVFWIVT